jgi:hypothetical protein
MTRKFTLVMMALTSLIVGRAFAFYNPVVEDRTLDIDVDANYDGSISGADDSIETSQGGIVMVGGWTNIMIQQTITTAVPGDPNTVRLSWLKEHIELAETSGGTAITPDGYMDTAQTTPYKDYPGLNTTKTLWVHGISTSHTARAEHLRLELIHFDQAYDPNSHDEIALTVVDVEKIEYRRLDQTAWVTETNIAAGAKNTNVHKAEVRITMTPAFSGLPIAATNSGGAGKNTPGALSPFSAQQTDANGQVYCTYTSSDKRSDVTVKVVECAGARTDVDLGSTLHEEWDIAGAYDFEFEDYFSPENPDPVKFYPTLNEIKGFGAIDGHSMGFYTPELTIIKTEFDFTNWNMTEDEITAYYPDYPELPSGYSITDFIEHSATTEISTGEYKNTQTVHDQWDYDAATDVLTFILVDGYEFAPYDESVYY